MYTMTAFQKSDILTKFWVWKNYPNIGGRIKRVAQKLEGRKKLISTRPYMYFQEKKIPYVLHARVNLKL